MSAAADDHALQPEAATHSRLAGPSGARKAVAPKRYINMGSVDGSPVEAKYQSLQNLRAAASLQHPASVYAALVYSGDNGEQCLASACGFGTITLWNLKTRQNIAGFQHGSFVRALAIFSNADDGELCLASGGAADGNIKLWNLKTHQELATLTGHASAVLALAVYARNADHGRELCLASASQDATIKLWNLRTRQELATLSGHSRPVCSLAVFANADDGALSLASGSDDHTIKVWNLETHQKSATLTGHVTGVTSLAVFMNG